MQKIEARVELFDFKTKLPNTVAHSRWQSSFKLQ